METIKKIKEKINRLQADNEKGNKAEIIKSLKEKIKAIENKEVLK